MQHNLPSKIYQKHIIQNHLQTDPLQIAVLRSFDALSQRISSRFSLFSRLLRPLSYRYNVKPGIYLWGSVGIGKTFLMDCFYDAVPTTRKRRYHFYAFMRELHIALREHAVRPNPLKYVAKKIHHDVDVLCFDEFFVKDIVDAMLFSELLPVLFELGVFFVATSNVAPDDLYEEGLQRQNFFPTIDLLKKNLEIIHLISTNDYRLRNLQSMGSYYTPLNAQAQQHIQQAFHFYETRADNELMTFIELLRRQVPVIKKSAIAVWFDFTVLCGAQRCQQDYLALTQEYQIIFLSNVPALIKCSLNEVTRFIQLIDILYDARIKLVISAALPPQMLYTQGELLFEFQRTVSRLIEMQSAEYFNAKTK